MNVPVLVLRNLTRRKARFVLTLSGVATGIAALVTLFALGGSLQREIRQQATELGANLVVTPKGWCAYEQVSVLTGERLPEAIPSEAVEAISRIEGILAVPYLTERTAIDNYPVAVVGILPGRMKRFRNWSIGEGRYFSEETESGLVVGAGIAHQFDLHPGADLTIRGAGLKVLGILAETGTRDDIAIYMPLTEAQRRYDAGNNVSFVAVKVDDLERIDHYTMAIEEAANVAVVSDKQLLRSVLAIVGTVNVTLRLIAAVALLTAAFGVINTMLTAIHERRREIGILQAIGGTRQTIFGIFLLESGAYGLFGGILGVVIGVVASRVFEPLISQNEFTAFVKASGTASTLEPGLLFLSVLLSVLIAGLSGLYPAWRASRLSPVEAIRYE